MQTWHAKINQHNTTNFEPHLFIPEEGTLSLRAGEEKNQKKKK